MIVLLHPDTNKQQAGYLKLIEYLNGLQRIQVRTHEVVGVQQTLTELYLIGNTAALDAAEISRMMYLSVQPTLKADTDLSTSRMIVVEVGGGSTEVLVIERGQVVFSHKL